MYQYPFFHSQQHKPLLALPTNDFWPDLLNCMYTEYEAQPPHRNEILLSFLHILLENAARLYCSEAFSDKAPGAVARVREFELLLNRHLLHK